ncbi:MAG: ATP-binding protein, partial [Culicoidibacterales bacterium]
MSENNQAAFKVLSDKEHVLMNPDMYIGATSSEPFEVLVDGEFKQIKYVQGLAKILDEIIDNSIDEAIRTNFKFANQISVTFKDNTFSVSDNGRGIPQDMVELPDGTTEPRPMASWTKARAGSNFTKDRTTIGKNGIGSALTNFFSTSFVGETCDGKNLVTVKCTNSAEHVSYTTKAHTEKGTKVTFTPDLTLFNLFKINDDFADVIMSRLHTLAVCFPSIKFKFNNKVVPNSFTSFMHNFGSTVHHNAKGHSVFFASSETGFKQLSYVNGVHTKQGGAHVDGIMNSISDEMIVMIKRKYKIEVNRARIKDNMLLCVFLRDFVGAKFDSQTKERLSSTWAQIRDHMNLDFKKLAKSVVENDDIIKPIIAAELARKNAADAAAAARAQKSAKKAKVAKHIKASSLGKKPCTLFLTEGDSAIGYLLKVRDGDTQGGFPLRGKVLNVHDLSDAEVLKNTEIQNLVSIFGVGLHSKESPAYDKIAILTDADQDGVGAIFPLLLNFMYKYWPHWFEEKRICFVRTPEFISTNGKKTVWCYDK